jgi:FKBP-type peptidyl-prolyl cis-trans isomerase
MRMRKIVVAAALCVAATPVMAQDGYVSPSRDAAWHNRQSLALAERAAEGWYALPGGVLWHRVEGDGQGPRPTIDEQVRVHYEGTLVDGTKFDSSYDRGEPATFPLRGLVRAWQTAIPNMAVGDTIEIAVPAAQAYGPIGRGPIPGGATLLFTIELLGISSR